jgi:polysaccharide export outer membrane protein
LPVCRAVLCATLLVLSLVACSGGLSRNEVIAQAAPSDGQIAFNVVKIDDAVLSTLLDRPPPAFGQRFKKYVPPPELQIAVGDTVAVVIWESAANGLFGNSITELSLPAGAAALLNLGRPAAPGGVPSLPGGITPTPELLASLFGGTVPARAAQSGALASGTLASGTLQSGTLQSGIAPPNLSGRLGPNAVTSGVLDGPRSSRFEQFLALAQQTGRPGTRIPDQQVGPDGAISVPYAGRIKIAGHTPAEVERRIEEELRTKALEPQALVVVKRSVANSVSVAGEAVGGARVPLSPGGDRLLQVIAAAGGAKAPVHDTFVRLSRRGVTATVSLAALVADPEQNIFAEPGDVLTLVRQPQTYSVFGATGRNAAITFTSERLSLTEALAKAGGLRDERADPAAVFLFRYEPVELVRALGQPIAAGAPAGLSPIVYRLDLRAARSYLLAKRFPVRDKDIIFVADAELVPTMNALRVLSQITGPITSGLLICQTTKNC